MSLTVSNTPAANFYPKSAPYISFSASRASTPPVGRLHDDPIMAGLMSGDSVDAHPLIDGTQEQDYALLHHLRAFLSDASPLQQALILKNPKLVLTYLQAYHQGLLDKLSGEPAANDSESASKAGKAASGRRLDLAA